jgi:hypothetical protein
VGVVGPATDRRGLSPHFASVVASAVHTTDLGRVAQVSDESDLDHDAGLDDANLDDADLDDADLGDQAAEIEAAMAEARARLADVPPEVVVVNHVMGLYELGAIHLSSPTPDLPAASLAIDAMALLVDGLGDRLGDDAETMRDALANIRMAFVGVKAQTARLSDD